MKDDRVEELLRGAWRPEPPDRMRGRVLARSREEMARRSRPNLRWMLGWKPALAALGIAIVLFTHIEDNRRAARITAMVNGSSVSSLEQKSDYLRMRREMSDLLAQMPGDGRAAGQITRGEGL